MNCAGCRKQIVDRYYLAAIDELWHEDCLKCSCCECRLGEVGSSLFVKGDLLTGRGQVFDVRQGRSSAVPEGLLVVCVLTG